MAAASPGNAFGLYAESGGRFDKAQPGATETALALANPSRSAVTVHLELTDLDGTHVTARAAMVISGGGRRSLFLRQIPELAALPNPTAGLLRVRTDSGTLISVASFLARYNERREFLITALPPANENDPSPSAERVFPQLISGGGVTTEVLLFGPPRASGVLRLYSQSGDPVGPALR
jgi:hypothetical protein